ncbi:hypothetical protein P7K49_004948 [Saguinus oedipus]|uniref:Uncharacterized protein n=1 Tax=Saguinus oedipus TaxID=9490 RepID=A0ABQ9W8X0_SAGOE|nr:hypothetical protein P7K49_004948 [Saguinus oedipus]
MKAECFQSLSAMELAEQITLLDHIIFRSIPYDSHLAELPGQVNAQYKPNKERFSALNVCALLRTKHNPCILQESGRQGRTEGENSASD